MDTPRTFQTTLVHPLRAELSVSMLFARADFPPHTNAETVARAMGLEAISGGDISADELKRILACILLHRFDVFDMDARAFTAYVNESTLEVEYLERAMSGNVIVVERQAPVSTALVSLLHASLGAALALYPVPAHERARDPGAPAKIELFDLVMPYGVLLCGSVRGLARALQYGLFDSLHGLLAGAPLGPAAVPPGPADASCG